MSPGNLFVSQRVEGQGYKWQKQCWRGYLHYCECWLLLVSSLVDVIQIRWLCKRLATKRHGNDDDEAVSHWSRNSSARAAAAASTTTTGTL